MKRRVFGILCLVIILGVGLVWAGEVFSPQDVLRTKSCRNAMISPDGQWIAYTVSVPRTACEKSGSSYSEMYIVSTETGKIRPFITGKVSVSEPRWSPDGARIAFRMRRDGDATQVWTIALSGGEAVQMTRSKTSVSTFRWRPDGKKIAYIAETPETAREKKLEEKGYMFITYEENLKHRNLYLTCAGGGCEHCQPEQLTEGVTVWGFEFSPDGKTLAAGITEKNLVDQRYMFQRVHLLDVETKTLTQLTHNPGKLGNYVFSPDGKKLAYAAALELKDHATSQAFVIDVAGGESVNLTPPNFKGHVNHVFWKDNKTLMYRAGEGMWPTLSLVNVKGGARRILLHAKDADVIFDSPTFTSNFKHFAFTGDRPNHPDNIYYWTGKGEPKKLTVVNPWLAERDLGRQEIVRYAARDGQEIEGLLIHPVGYEAGNRYPLVVLVHGGPESHYSNGWVTRYSTPGQVLAGMGYVVFYPNYRASTGYGLEFALAGYEDAAGVEFDDIADGIRYLVDEGIADADRVGLGGGSYGGYAAGWFSSYYTDLVKGVCMFVGISDIPSKRGTTDIPYEEMYVHSGKRLEDDWEFELKRSPIYWAHQSKTAVLILGGTEDTRVHPSQSLEYYRRLKMNDHPAVRLVQYPGEGHGNRKQTSQTDLLHRILGWYDWYVKDVKALDGPMPPLDISDKYGIGLK